MNRLIRHKRDSATLMYLYKVLQNTQRERHDVLQHGLRTHLKKTPKGFVRNKRKASFAVGRNKGSYTRIARINDVKCTETVPRTHAATGFHLAGRVGDEQLNTAG